MSHTLTTGADSILSYEKYRFRLKAINMYGDSDYSEELPAAIAPLPSAPAIVNKDQIKSTKTSI